MSFGSFFLPSFFLPVRPRSVSRFQRESGEFAEGSQRESFSGCVEVSRSSSSILAVAREKKARRREISCSLSPPQNVVGELLKITTRIRRSLLSFPGFHQCRGLEHARLAGLEVESRAEEAKNKQKEKQPESMPLFFFLPPAASISSPVVLPFHPAASSKKKNSSSPPSSSPSSPPPIYPKNTHLATGKPPRRHTWRASPAASGTRRRRPAGEGERSRPRRARPARRRGNWAAGRRFFSSTSPAPRSRGGPPTW